MRALLRPIAVAFCLPLGCSSLPAITEPTVEGGGVDAAIPDASGIADGGAADATPVDGGEADGGEADGGLERDAGPNVDGLRAGCGGSRGVLSLPQVALTATSVYWVGPACGAGERTPVLHKTPRAFIASGAPLCGQGVEFALPAADPAFVLPTSEGVAVVTQARDLFRLEEANGLTSTLKFGGALPMTGVLAAAVAAKPNEVAGIAWLNTNGTPSYDIDGTPASAGTGGQHRGIAITSTSTTKAYIAQTRAGMLNIEEKPGFATPAISADATSVAQIHVAGTSLLVRQGTTISSNVSSSTLAPVPNIVSEGIAAAVGAPMDVVSFQTVAGAAQLSLLRRSQDSWTSKALGTATPFEGIGIAVTGGTMIDIATTGACLTTSDSFINFERFAKPAP